MHANTPADVLAGRLAVLTPDQRHEVANAWRTRRDDAALKRDADTVAATWRTPSRLPAAGNVAGWQPDQELLLQVGLDRLLGLSHPDVGHPDESRLSRTVTAELAQRYLSLGYWFRAADVLLLPRRAGTKGLRYPAAGPEPLAYTCAILGQDAQAVAITRVPQEHEIDDAGRPPFGAGDCAVAPLVGADALGLSFAERSGRWTYGPDLQDSVLQRDLLERILDSADAAKAAVLVLPEYCSSPTQLQQWTDVLSTRPAGSVRWLLTGTGPAAAEDAEENIATLISRNTKVAVHQSKVRPFDLHPGALEAWQCPNIPEAAQGQPITERSPVSGKWMLLECNRGRLAVAICESFRPTAGNHAIAPLAEARPTLLLCPVFSQPLRNTCWERSATETWGQLGVETLVANSLVVAQWQAAGGELDPAVACAAARALADESRGHVWKTYTVEPALDAGATESIVHIGSSTP